MLTPFVFMSDGYPGQRATIGGEFFAAREFGWLVATLAGGKAASSRRTPKHSSCHGQEWLRGGRLPGARLHRQECLCYRDAALRMARM
jgi:hypothetical protein